MMRTGKETGDVEASSVSDDVGERRKSLDREGRNLVSLTQEIQDAQSAVELANLEEYHESDDEEDYLETVSFEMKTDVKKAEEDHKAKAAQILYGTPDPNVPASNVPCSGCGAELHCQDPQLPGYIPSQRFKVIPPKILKDSICQRCMMMREHDVALKVSVKPEEYRSIVSEIQGKIALCVVVMDIMDPESSIFPGLLDLIGKKRPLYIVANKVDMLPKDEPGYLDRARDVLVKICEEKGLLRDAYVHHVALVSAKTGFGIEELVTRLMKDWSRRGDVYILGCTNAGKSTLFNSLLGSDYCKALASEFMQRATICRWPGTTLKVLRFPIIDPAPWRLKKRDERLSEARVVLAKKLQRQKDLSADFRKNRPCLIGNVGQTFCAQDSVLMPSAISLDSSSSYTFDDKSGELVETGRLEESLPEVGYSESKYKKSRWCYDTPGVVNPEQIINILTQKELRTLISSVVPYPRTYTLTPGRCMFITGLARLDYTKGDNSIYVTFVGNPNLPIHVLEDWEMEHFYERHFGRKRLGLPIGDPKFLPQRIPALVGKDLSFSGIGWEKSVADITLSSLGFVTVTGGVDHEFTLRVSTPGAAGIHARYPSLLPYAVKLRGKRLRYGYRYTIRKAPAIHYVQDYVMSQRDKYFGDHRNEEKQRERRAEKHKRRESRPSVEYRRREERSESRLRGTTQEPFLEELAAEENLDYFGGNERREPSVRYETYSDERKVEKEFQTHFESQRRRIKEHKRRKEEERKHRLEYVRQ